jgi:hypothetical protein
MLNLCIWILDLEASIAFCNGVSDFWNSDLLCTKLGVEAVSISDSICQLDSRSASKWWKCYGQCLLEKLAFVVLFFTDFWGCGHYISHTRNWLENFVFVHSALQDRGVGMHPETGQSLVFIRSRVMWSLLQKHFQHNWRIHLGCTMLNTRGFQFSMLDI